MRAVLIALTIALAGVACGGELAGDDALGPATAAAESPVIVSLRFNDATLRVHGDERFTLLDADGALLADRVTREELGAIAPDLAARYDEMVAGAVLDASVDPDLLAPAEGGLYPSAP